MSAAVEQVVRSASEGLVAVLQAEMEGALSRLRNVEHLVTEEIEGCKLLTKSQAASLLGCSRRQLDRWIAVGALSVIWLDRRPRFRPEDLKNLAIRRQIRVSSARGGAQEFFNSTQNTRRKEIVT